jgi:hypothetical protein
MVVEALTTGILEGMGMELVNHQVQSILLVCLISA